MKKEVKTRNQEIYLSGELLIKRDLRRSHSKRLMLCSTLVLLNAFLGEVAWTLTVFKNLRL